jgi:hypothetical protein
VVKADERLLASHNIVSSTVCDIKKWKDQLEFHVA